MAQEKHYTWLSAHLYFDEPWEDFLIKIVKPYCETVVGSSAAEYYFFIRYWDRGPHIRLRFYGKKEALENILRPNLEEYFKNFFRMTPSERDEPSYHPNTPEEEIWLPNNSVQWIDYQPELERYGGIYGVALTERNFAASSKTVLKCIEEVGSKNWTYEQALGIAIKLHLSFVHAMDMNLSDVAEFFNGILHHWLPLTLQRERITQAQLTQQGDVILHSFEQFFAGQQEALVSYHAAFWEALSENADFEDEFLNEWYKSCQFTRQEVMLAEAQDLLVERTEKYRISFFAHKEKKDCLRWEIYADFFHLTNNRLGILNRDESYLAYLMMRSVEHLSE